MPWLSVAATNLEANMTLWLKRFRDAFRAWLKTNEEAYAKSKPHSCCSAPPPGAGGPSVHRRDKP